MDAGDDFTFRRDTRRDAAPQEWMEMPTPSRRPRLVRRTRPRPTPGRDGNSNSNSNNDANANMTGVRPWHAVSAGDEVRSGAVVAVVPYSLAHRQDGAPFAARARAAELDAHRKHHEGPADDEGAGAPVLASEMGKRQSWRPLALEEFPIPADEKTSDNDNDNDNDNATISGATENSRFPFHSKRPSAEHAKALILHTHRRQRHSGQFNDFSGVVSNPSLAPEPPQTPTPAPTPPPYPSHYSQQAAMTSEERYQQLLAARFADLGIEISRPRAANTGIELDRSRYDHRRFVADVGRPVPEDSHRANMPRPVVNLPPSSASITGTRPPSHYPAVKGTSSDARYHQRMAELQRQVHDTSARPAVQSAQASSDDYSKRVREGIFGDLLPHRDGPVIYIPRDQDLIGSRVNRADPFSTRVGPPSTRTVPSSARVGPSGSRTGPNGKRPEAPSGREMPTIQNRHDDEWFYADRRFDQDVAEELKRNWHAVQQEEAAKKKKKQSAAKDDHVTSLGPVGDERQPAVHNTSGGEKSVYDAADDGSDSKGKQKEQASGSEQLTEEEKKVKKQQDADKEAKEMMENVWLPLFATLHSYTHGERDYWNQNWVQPPDWCIDNSPAGRQSYFGENWGTPPARVGRDPRYRPFAGDSRSAQGFASSNPLGASPTARRPPSTPSNPRGSAYQRSGEESGGSGGGGSRGSGQRRYR